ncbi:hypothetical protein OKW27_007136 [Paraburkholderia sp. 35.1]
MADHRHLADAERIEQRMRIARELLEAVLVMLGLARYLVSQLIAKTPIRWAFAGFLHVAKAILNGGH